MGDARTRGGQQTLIGLVILALALRIAWWIGYVDVIENEGVEYARLALNWFHGRGYVSIFGGTHILFPPLYPLFIGLVAPLAGSEEAAARVVSLLGGLAVVGVGYLLARRAFSERVAILSGGVLACHPVLVALSVSTYSESLYLGLVMVGTLATVQAATTPSRRAALLAGVVAGLAYLTRPEGLAIILGFGGLIAVGLMLHRQPPGRVAGYALLPVIAGIAIGSPYMWHLSRIAGAFRWEGKSAVNNRMVEALDQGMNLREAGRGLGPQGEPRGVWLFPDQHALLAEPAGSSKGLVRAMTEDPVGRLRSFGRPLLSARHLGSPLLLPLVVAGLLLTGWWKQRTVEGLGLLVLPAVTVLVMLGVRWNWPRYYFPLLPTGLVWATAGAERLGRAAASLTRHLGWTGARQDAASLLLAALPLLGLGLLSLRYLPRLDDISQTRNHEVRLVGALIGADARSRSPAVERPRIATGGLAVAHYAGGEATYLPYADETRTLAYLRRLAPQYLVLRRTSLQNFPYARKWVEEGPGDPCAESLAPSDGASLQEYKVWRWRCPSTGSLP